MEDRNSNHFTLTIKKLIVKSSKRKKVINRNMNFGK